MSAAPTPLPTVLQSLEELQQNLDEYKFVVLDTYTNFCLPCKQIAPTFAAYANEFKSVRFLKVDVQHVAEVADKYDVRSIPTFLFFVDGELQSKLTLKGADAAGLRQRIHQMSSSGMPGKGK